MTPYRTEWIVYDEEIELAGSIDMIYICKDTGHLHIYDWKRCKQIKKSNPWQSSHHELLNHIPDTNFWHYALQLNMYKTILERKYNCIVDELWLVCLHPNNTSGTYIKYKVPHLQDEMNAIINQLKKNKG